MKPRTPYSPLWWWLGLLVASSPLAAQTPTGVNYTLIDSSALLDDCLICGRPTLIYSLRGTFTLVPLDSTPLFMRYRMTNIVFKATRTGGPDYDLTGTGVYEIGGEVAVIQRLTLELKVNDRSLVFTNDARAVEHPFPLIDITVAQTEPNVAQFFTLQLVAAPVREIWCSTASAFSSALNNLRASPGDVLSASGRIVVPSSNLVAQLDLPAAAGSPGIDALDVGPGGEIFFSFDQNQNSTNLGLIHHGDLVSNGGRVVQAN